MKVERRDENNEEPFVLKTEEKEYVFEILLAAITRIFEGCSTSFLMNIGIPT